MIGKLRTFGALTFWSAVVMVAMSPMLLVYWLQSGGGNFMWWWAMGLVLLLMAMILALQQRWWRLVAIVLEDGSDSGRLRVPRGLRVPSHCEVVLIMQPLVGVVAILQVFNIVQSGGMLSAVIFYACMWPFLQIIPWMAWARNRHQDPLPPKQGVNRSGGVRVWNLTAEDEGVEATVRLAEESSFAEVLREVVRTPVLPAIAGGERTWLVLVDGGAVGVLTQTWEHPRWWPQIVWDVDASDRFEGERIRFEPSDR